MTMIRCLAMTFTLGAILQIMMPVPARAIPAITCHCFTDRSYDATKPSAADPYFLASAQNAFFAGVFGIDKKSVVMMKQQGVSADDLWVAYWVASNTAGAPDQLLQARGSSASWQETLAPLRLPLDRLGDRFAQAVAASLPAERLAAAVVDELLVGYRLIAAEDLDAMRQAGCSNQELILAAVLASRTGQPVRRILLDREAGTGSWGAMLHAAGIDGKNLPQAVAATLNRPDRP